MEHEIIVHTLSKFGQFCPAVADVPRPEPEDARCDVEDIEEQEPGDLVRENQRLAEAVRMHEQTLAGLERQFPGITHLQTDDQGYYVASPH